MARTKEFERTEVLNRALETFIARGFSATSIQDLIESTGINRQSLYNEFGDKKQLYITALEAYCDAHKESVREVLELEQPARMVLEKYKNQIKAKMNCEEGSRGCLVVSAIMGASNADPDVKAVVERLFIAKTRMLAAVIARGQKAGELPAKHAPQALADALNAAITGVVVMARGGAKPAQLLPIIDVAFEGLA